MNHEEAIKCINAYREEYPEDQCTILATADYIVIVSENKSVFNSMRLVKEEEFMRMLKESKETGRNVFIATWKETRIEKGDIL